MDEQKRDIVKVVRHEFDVKVNHVLKEMINVPGLVGENCKYSSFHRCMLDFNRAIQHNHTDLRVYKETFREDISQIDMQVRANQKYQAAIKLATEDLRVDLTKVT